MFNDAIVLSSTEFSEEECEDFTEDFKLSDYFSEFLQREFTTDGNSSDDLEIPNAENFYFF